SPLERDSLPAWHLRETDVSALDGLLVLPTTWSLVQGYLLCHDFSDMSIQRVLAMLEREAKRHTLSLSCVYRSVSPQGDSLWVSGRIYLPRTRRVRGVVLAPHFTICADREAPSRRVGLDVVFALEGYVVVVPDYVGYGVSAHLTHPYLHWHSAATTAVDMLSAVPDLLSHYGYEVNSTVDERLSWDKGLRIKDERRNSTDSEGAAWRPHLLENSDTNVTSPSSFIFHPSSPKILLWIVGYSQGAAAALGAVRLLEEREESPWHIAGLYAGGGPYDVAGTYDACVAADSTGIPCAIPMLVMGTSEAYTLGLRKQDFFKEPLLSHYEDWIGEKRYTMNEIKARMGSCRLSDAMTREGMDKTSPETARFYHALQQSSIVGYAPACPSVFFHSTDDDMVPCMNTLRQRDACGGVDGIWFDIAPYGSHMKACLRFYGNVYRALH
ncbi:MAG: hypothetical protein ACI4TV_01820, partial [Paludibacteraceae bacterium]